MNNCVTVWHASEAASCTFAGHEPWGQIVTQRWKERRRQTSTERQRPTGVEAIQWGADWGNIDMWNKRVTPTGGRTARVGTPRNICQSTVSANMRVLGIDPHEVGGWRLAMWSEWSRKLKCKRTVRTALKCTYRVTFWSATYQLVLVSRRWPVRPLTISQWGQGWLHGW